MIQVGAIHSRKGLRTRGGRVEVGGGQWGVQGKKKNGTRFARTWQGVMEGKNGKTE